MATNGGLSVYFQTERSPLSTGDDDARAFLIFITKEYIVSQNMRKFWRFTPPTCLTIFQFQVLSKNRAPFDKQKRNNK